MAQKDMPNIAAQTFTFREVAAATKNFRPESFLGEGGFGRVYKGWLESTGQVNCCIFSIRDVHYSSSYALIDYYNMNDSSSINSVINNWMNKA